MFLGLRGHLDNYSLVEKNKLCKNQLVPCKKAPQGDDKRLTSQSDVVS